MKFKNIRVGIELFVKATGARVIVGATSSANAVWI